jgi:hypothetical protein
LARNFFVMVRALRIHAEDFDVARGGLAPIVAEFAELFGAARGTVAGVEDQDHVAAAQGREDHGSTGIVQGVEIGGCGRRATLAGQAEACPHQRDAAQ